MRQKKQNNTQQKKSVYLCKVIHYVAVAQASVSTPSAGRSIETDIFHRSPLFFPPARPFHNEQPFWSSECVSLALSLNLNPHTRT